MYKHYRYTNEIYVTSRICRASPYPRAFYTLPLSPDLNLRQHILNLKPSFSSLYLLQPLFCDLFDRNLTVVDVLGGGKDGGPVLEDGEWHSLTLAESNQVYIS